MNIAMIVIEPSWLWTTFVIIVCLVQIVGDLLNSISYRLLFSKIPNIKIRGLLIGEKWLSNTFFKNFREQNLNKLSLYEIVFITVPNSIINLKHHFYQNSNE